MTDLIGKRLGQYEILSVLGEGGMGVVYQARQLNVNRDVAVKVINKNREVAENFVARFSREAQTIAHLSHPHILKLFADATRLTQSGMAMGTPAYMSPEAWKGEPVDSRSDIYSLGVMLYEMLSGDLPFHGDSPAQLMYAHITNPPPHLNQLPALSP